VKNQQNSAFKDWFNIKSFEDPAAGTHLSYAGWFGVKELPEWRQDENGLVAGPRDYIFNITRRWMAPDGHVENGIDGWRLDVAFLVKHPFWKAWHALVRSINPNAYTTAEVIDTVDANKPFLQGDEFTAVMNYNFAFATSEFFFHGQGAIGADEFDNRLRALRNAYAPQVAYGMQNLVDSHDTARVASNIVNAKLVDYRDWAKYCDATKATNPAYDTRKPNARQRQIQKLLAIFQMTYVGAPMIYYGDEAGMWGGNDPDCRKPMVWPDIQYAPESHGPTGPHAPDAVSFDHDMFEHYRKLIAIRKSQPALQLGEFRSCIADDEKQLYAFARAWQHTVVLVILNNGSEPQTAKIEVSATHWHDLLNGTRLTAQDGAVHVTVPPTWGAKA
jgi:glycosidase